MSPIKVKPEVVVYVEYGEEVWRIVFSAEGVCKIGFCPRYCGEGGKVEPADWGRFRRPTPGTDEHPEPWPPAILEMEEVEGRKGEFACGDALCFELPNGELICLPPRE